MSIPALSAYLRAMLSPHRAQAHEQGVAVDNGRTARAAAVVQPQPQKLVARVHELRR